MNNSKPTAAKKLRDQVDIFESFLEEFARCPHDEETRLDAGYAALHAARFATELFNYQARGVKDIAPGVTEHEPYEESKDTLRRLLRKVMTDDLRLDPLEDYAKALRSEPEPFTVAVAASGAAVSLLGTKEYGGVMAAWQLDTIALTEMQWTDHVRFNRVIREDLDKISVGSAIAAALRYNLPEPDFIQIGARGNSLKAILRALATSDFGSVDVASLVEPFESALELMRQIETFESSQKPEYLVETMRAMIAGVDTILNRRELSQVYWDAKSLDERNQIVAKVKEIEYCEELVKLVAQSANH